MRPTSRRTPRLLAGDDDATNDDAGRRSRPSSRDMRSVRKDFFLHVPNDSRETTHGRAVSYRAFVPKGRRVVLARSLVGGRSFTRSKARGRTRASTGRCARPVSFYRIAMSFPRVRGLESAGASLLDSLVSRETRRREERRRMHHHRSNENIIIIIIILQSTTSTLLPIRARARA